MTLRNVDAKQLLDTYASRLGREALPVDSPPPIASVSVRTQKALSQAEMIFTLEAVIWRAIAQSNAARSAPVCPPETIFNFATE